MAPPTRSVRSVVERDGRENESTDPDWEEAWEAELDRRIADVREGRVQLIAVEETLAKLDAALSDPRRTRSTARHQERGLRDGRARLPRK